MCYSDADLTDPPRIEKLVAATVREIGAIDILVNCVGGMTPGTLDSLTSEQWAEIINRNQMAYVHTTKAAIPHPEKSDGGPILHLTRIPGKQLMPGAYSTALPNAAINALTKLTANDLAAKGITVNNLCPGLVDTPRWTPRREAMAKLRNVTAEDIQALAAPVMRHRILVNYRAEAEGMSTGKVIEQLLETVSPEVG